jgi:hypothetical protein
VKRIRQKKGNIELDAVSSKVKHLAIILEETIIGFQRSGVSLLAAGSDNNFLHIAGAVSKRDEVFYISASPKRMSVDDSVFILVIAMVIAGAVEGPQVHFRHRDIISENPLSIWLTRITARGEDTQTNPLVSVERLVRGICLNLGLRERLTK